MSLKRSDENGAVSLTIHDDHYHVSVIIRYRNGTDECRSYGTVQLDTATESFYFFATMIDAIVPLSPEELTLADTWAMLYGSDNACNN